MALQQASTVRLKFTFLPTFSYTLTEREETFFSYKLSQNDIQGPPLDNERESKPQHPVHPAQCASNTTRYTCAPAADISGASQTDAASADNDAGGFGNPQAMILRSARCVISAGGDECLGCEQRLATKSSDGGQASTPPARLSSSSTTFS